MTEKGRIQWIISATRSKSQIRSYLLFGTDELGSVDLPYRDMLNAQLTRSKTGSTEFMKTPPSERGPTPTLRKP